MHSSVLTLRFVQQEDEREPFSAAKESESNR